MLEIKGQGHTWVQVLIHEFLGTLESVPNGILIGLVDFAGLANVTNRQTDRPCHSCCSNRPHLMHRVHAMRPKNMLIINNMLALRTQID